VALFLPNSEIRIALRRSQSSIARNGKSHASRWTTLGGQPWRCASAEIRVSSDDHKSVIPSIMPDLLIVCLLQPNVAHMCQPRKKQAQTIHQTRRKVFVEKQFHPRFALRPTSAA